jgi:hypothetical protein
MLSRARHIHIDYAGQTYSGSYQVVDAQIVVSSPYGTRSMPAIGPTPGRVATELLKQIAAEYRR